MKTLNRYQKLAARTAGDIPDPVNMVMGLAGESGEVCDMLKKVWFHGHDLDMTALKKELGDVLWYVAMLADCYGLDLQDVAQANIDKLKARYPNGFSEKASKERGAA